MAANPGSSGWRNVMYKELCRMTGEGKFMLKTGDRRHEMEAWLVKEEGMDPRGEEAWDAYLEKSRKCIMMRLLGSGMKAMKARQAK